MRTIRPSESLEDNLYATCIGWGETYGEHKKNCEFGCALCAPERRREARLRKREQTSIAGVPGSVVMQQRKAFYEQSKISNWFFSREDMRDKKGALITNVFIVLQLQDFSDSEIRHYFRINNSEWSRFKKDKFKDWSNNKEDYLSKLAAPAMKWYKHTYLVAHQKH